MRACVRARARVFTTPLLFRGVAGFVCLSSALPTQLSSDGWFSGTTPSRGKPETRT